MKMAGGGGEGAGFWLPAEFLTDDDFSIDKGNFSKSNTTEPDPEFCFPTEFPYDFETQTDQLLEKFWMMSTSPQSTLAHLGSAGGSTNGSPNAAPSPPTTPLGAKYDAVGDLIYLAAGQVAKLKLNRGYVEKALSLPPLPERSHAQFYPEAKTPSVSLHTHFRQKQENEGYEMWYTRQQQLFQNRGGMAVGRIDQAAWTPNQNRASGRAVLLGGGGGGGGGAAAAKRACAGTGVFLPRRYENINDSNAYSSDSQKKPGAPFPGRAAVQVHAKHFDNVNGFVQYQPRPQARIDRGFVPDYDSLLARRRAVVLQQQRSLLTSLAEGSSMMGRDHLCLPQEWTY